MSRQSDFDTTPRMPNIIETFFHCADCVREKPDGVSMEEYARLNIGVTPEFDMQIWCVRHNKHVALIPIDPGMVGSS